MRISQDHTFSHKKTALLQPNPAIKRPFHYRVFHRNSISMKISFHSPLDSNTVIATKFCTWHDSCVVVACAKPCCDLMASNEITASESFHRISIAAKKSLMKRYSATIKAERGISVPIHKKIGQFTINSLRVELFKFYFAVEATSDNTKLYVIFFNPRSYLTGVTTTASRAVATPVKYERDIQRYFDNFQQEQSVTA